MAYKFYADQLANQRLNYYRNGNQQKAAEKQRNKISNRKCFILETKGEQCIECGATENLEFDHINPYFKSGRASFATMSRKQLLQELDNCQVLCHDCHSKRTHAQRQAAWHLYCQLSPAEQAELEELYYNQ